LKTLLSDYLRVFRHVTRVCICIVHSLFIRSKNCEMQEGRRKSFCYIIFLLILCACSFNPRESANSCSFFSLHSLITGNDRCVQNKKRTLPTWVVLPGCLLIFLLEWKMDGLRISDHCSKVKIKMCVFLVFIQAIASIKIRYLYGQKKIVLHTLLYLTGYLIFR
jgi:hypothetical protein